MARCLYCRQDGPRTAFTKDHVLPSMFGRFKQNLTLRGLVCRSCNQYFGDNLEPFLAEDALEALVRLKRGIKGPSAAKFLRRSRIRIQWDSATDWKGVTLRLKEQNGELVYEPLPQIGFKCVDRDGFKYVEEEELRATMKPPDGTDPRLGVSIVWNNEAAREKLFELAHRLNLPVKDNPDEYRRPPFQDGKVRIHFKTEIDDIIRRCICKIAVNYAAYFLDKDILWSNDFAEICRFVRFGARPAKRPIRIVPGTIIAGGPQRDVDGHIVTLEWTPDRDALISQVSLFNQLRYVVTLLPRFRGIWRPARYGHVFELGTRTVCPMIGASSHLLGGIP